jgi:hypothetical protein
MKQELFIPVLVFMMPNLFLFLYWVGVHCGIYKSSYNKSTTSYSNLPPPPSPLSSPPHSWNSFNRCCFSIYIDVYTLYSPSIISPPPLSHWYQPPHTQSASQDLFCLHVFWFYKRKRWHFCLFKISPQEVSLWHFHVYMYYSPNWFITSTFFFLH